MQHLVIFVLQNSIHIVKFSLEYIYKIIIFLKTKYTNILMSYEIVSKLERLTWIDQNETGQNNAEFKWVVLNGIGFSKQIFNMFYQIFILSRF